MRRRPAAIAALAAGAALAAAGCGGAGKPDLTVSAAASLQKAFTRYGDQFSGARARFSFAGSDQLAAQISSGVTPDVFAAANTKLPAQLHAKGLASAPVVFAANKLVIAVPSGSTKVRSLADLAKPGVTLAIGSASVPIGAYTRKVLGGLPRAQQAKILANVRSNEPDVAGIVGKVTEGAVDAGFVYVTDVDASGGRARAIPIPSSLAPRVAYGVVVVKGAKHPAQARAFIAGLRNGAGARDLRAAGFGAPPR